MSDAKQLVTQLFKNSNVNVPANRMLLFDRFLQDKQNLAIINQIIQNQNQLMAKWQTEERIADILQQSVRIANATVGKPYEAKLDFEKYGWQDIVS